MSSGENIKPATMARLAKELNDLTKKPIDDIDVVMSEEDITDFHAIIKGPGGCMGMVVHFFLSNDLRIFLLWVCVVAYLFVSWVGAVVVSHLFCFVCFQWVLLLKGASFALKWYLDRNIPRLLQRVGYSHTHTLTHIHTYTHTRTNCHTCSLGYLHVCKCAPFL